MNASNEALLRRIYQAMNARELQTLGETVRDDVIVHGMEGDGLDAVRQGCAAFLDAFDDLEVIVEDVVSSGDRVAGRTVARGTHTGELGGMPATGRRIEVRQHDFARVEDGKLAEIWTLYDQFGLLSQLGVIPTSQPA